MIIYIHINNLTSSVYKSAFFESLTLKMAPRCFLKTLSSWWEMFVYLNCLPFTFQCIWCSYIVGGCINC